MKTSPSTLLSISPQEYVRIFKSEEVPERPISGLAGRILRGKTPEDFRTFSDDPDRKIVMFIGPDGLQKIIGKTGYEMLQVIGYQPDYLRHKVNEGNEFKLVVLPEGTAKIANWDNVIDMVCEIYPDIAHKIKKHRSQLKSTFFREIERQVGYRFLDVEKAGKSDERFMTYDRFLKSSGTLADVRAFFYFSIHLRELYRGDGYTDENGKRGPMEYVASNIPIADIPDHKIIDIDVKLPTGS